MAIALIYATTLINKSNEPLAKYISKKAQTDIFNLKDLMRLNLDAYDTVVFGTSNNGGKADKLVAEFVAANRDMIRSKQKYLYVLCSKDDEKNQEQAKAIADELGIDDAYLLPKKAEEMNEEGYPVIVDQFISLL
jgi:menaquinone-dependent protoporphyrinogen IX oxidase